jgi:hypothetical protein
MERDAGADRVVREASAEYLADMIAQMARLARGTGQVHVAILLEAVISVQRAIAQGASAR